MLESLRDSTLKKRKQRLEKEEELRSKGRKKSRKRRVSVTVVEEPNSSPEVSLASGNPSGVVLESQDPGHTSDSGSNSDPEKVIGSSESLDWDAKGDIDSPLKDEEGGFLVESLPPALSKFRSSSTSVNRVNVVDVDEADFDFQPVCIDLNSLLAEAGTEQSLQDTILRNNLQFCEQRLLEGILEENSNKSLSHSHSEEALDAIMSMDATTYGTRLKQLKSEVWSVELSISNFTDEDVTIVDKDHFMDRLKEIRQFYEVVLTAAKVLLNDLTEVREEDRVRINEINTIIQDLSTKLRDNEKKVKNKMAELIDAHDSKKTKDSSSKETEKEKFLVRIKHIKNNAEDLKSKIDKLPSFDEMSDCEVIEVMEEFKSWEKGAKEISIRWQKAQEDSVGLEIEEAQTQEVQATVEEAITYVEEKFEKVKLIDKKRGLYSNVKKTISARDIVYPEAFSGTVGEDFYNFKEDFEQAMNDAHVKEKDKLKKLREYLSSGAKILVRSHTDFDEAMNDLQKRYGDPSLIWEKEYEDIIKKLGSKSAWGPRGSEKRLDAVTCLVTFLKNIRSKIKRHEDLDRTIITQSNTSCIIALLPQDAINRFNLQVAGQQLSVVEKFDELEKFMESEINLVLEERTNTPPQKSTVISKGSAHHTNDANQGKVCIFCQGVDCKLEWDAFGCVELYKENTPNERREILRQNNLCFTCGSERIEKQGKKHACTWKNKLPVKCLGANCGYGAITCLNHYRQRNMTLELVKWIKSTKNQYKASWFDDRFQS